MTPDERMDTLAMHLDLLARVHLDFEKKMDERFDALTRVHEEFTLRMTEHAADVKDSIQRLTNIAADMKDSIQRLANIAEAHQETLDDHEERLDDLEN